MMTAAAALALLQAAAPAPAQTQTAEPFVRAVYASYVGSADDGALGRRRARFFSQGLLALMKRDEAANAAAGGGVGVLDGDPVCDCQDDSGLHLKKLEVTPVDAAHALATADLAYPDGGGHVMLKLVRTGRGWRIDDVKDDKEAWLRKLLTDEIQSLRPHARH